MKPVETGCVEGGGKLVPQDAAALKEASGCELPLEQICPYRFREPLAPKCRSREKQLESTSII